jgi:4-amino-4-deoxy-L-arabinose transferase-like glycosyltransferase
MRPEREGACLMTDLAPPLSDDARLDRWARWAPWLIALHVALLAGIRIALSPWLEVDESEFYGITHLALTYGNSHPPLYNWLMAGALALTGDNWSVSAALVKFPLLGVFHLLVWDAARRLGGMRAGMWALVAGALLPQIVWMAALTLTHSILVMAGTAAVIHALVVLRGTRAVGAWVWLGLALSLGALGKFNFALFAIPMLAAMLIVPGTRPILKARRAWISATVVAGCVGPVAIAAAMDLAGSAGRMRKLFSEAGATSGLDLPGVGLDGALSLMQAFGAWAGPALVVWIIVRRQGPRGAAGADAFLRALMLSMLLSLAVFALIVLAADMHRVRERYLTPMLIALPIWLAVARPLGRMWPARLALAAHLAAAVGVAGVVTLSPHRLAYPWQALAGQLTADLPGAQAVIGGRTADGANIALALGLPVVRDRAAPDGPVLLVWVGDRPPPTAFAAMLAPGAPRAVVRAPMTNLSGKTIIFSGALAYGTAVNAARR